MPRPSRASRGVHARAASSCMRSASTACCRCRSLRAGRGVARRNELCRVDWAAFSAATARCPRLTQLLALQLETPRCFLALARKRRAELCARQRTAAAAPARQRKAESGVVEEGGMSRCARARARAPSRGPPPQSFLARRSRACGAIPLLRQPRPSRSRTARCRPPVVQMRASFASWRATGAPRFEGAHAEVPSPSRFARRCSSQRAHLG